MSDKGGIILDDPSAFFKSEQLPKTDVLDVAIVAEVHDDLSRFFFFDDIAVFVGQSVVKRRCEVLSIQRATKFDKPAEVCEFPFIVKRLVSSKELFPSLVRNCAQLCHLASKCHLVVFA